CTLVHARDVQPTPSGRERVRRVGWLRDDEDQAAGTAIGLESTHFAVPGSRWHPMLDSQYPLKDWSGHVSQGTAFPRWFGSDSLRTLIPTRSGPWLRLAHDHGSDPLRTMAPTRSGPWLRLAQDHGLESQQGLRCRDEIDREGSTRLWARAPRFHPRSNHGPLF